MVAFQKSFKVVAGIDSAVDVAAGGMHTAVLDSNGKVCPFNLHQVFPFKAGKVVLQFGAEWSVGINVLGLDIWLQ